jgi:hypothetical protein
MRCSATPPPHSPIPAAGSERILGAARPDTLATRGVLHAWTVVEGLDTVALGEISQQRVDEEWIARRLILADTTMKTSLCSTRLRWRSEGVIATASRSPTGWFPQRRRVASRPFEPTSRLRGVAYVIDATAARLPTSHAMFLACDTREVGDEP